MRTVAGMGGAADSSFTLALAGCGCGRLPRRSRD